MERVVSTVGFSLGKDHFTDLDYADDVAFLAHAVDDLHTALDVLEPTASKFGLRVSWQKTKIQTWMRVILTYLTYQSADNHWKKLRSSHIRALFCRHR